MDAQSNILKSRIAILAVVLGIAALSCSSLPDILPKSITTTIPNGGKPSQDTTKSCQFGTPPGKGTQCPNVNLQNSKFDLQIIYERTMHNLDFLEQDNLIAMISLVTASANTFEGSYTGAITETDTGYCHGTTTLPISFDVTAKEDKSEGLDFSIQKTIGGPGRILNTWCGSTLAGSDAGPIPTVKGTITFTLPAVDGASMVIPPPDSDSGKWTYLLKKIGP